MSFNFNVGDTQLQRHVKAVQKIATKHQRICRRIDSMDPTCNNVKLNRTTG